MDGNNLNQENNNLPNNSFNTQPTPQTVETFTNNQFSTPAPMNTMNQTTKAPAKNKGPFIIFGVILAVTIVLVVSLFLENGTGTMNQKNLINDNTKTLIVYFSHDGENYGKNLDMENKQVLTTGNTEVMARRISDLIDADLYEIEPLVPYPNDLNELYGATKIEYNKNEYPEIKNKVSNLDDYDVIFIGYPIWHAAYPQIIKTFVRDNSDTLKNKIIVPFNTHAGSGSAGTYKKLFNLIGCPESKGLNGLAINGTEVDSSDETIKNWLTGIGYKLK